MLIQTLSILGLAALVTRGGGGADNPNITHAETGKPSDKVKITAWMQFDGQPLRTGPDKEFNEFTHAKKSDKASVLAKSSDEQWAFLWCDSGDGWVPMSSIWVEGKDISSLPEWNKPIDGYTYKPEATMARETDLKNGFAANFKTLACVPKNQYVKLLAQSPDTFWVFAWSDMGDGWVPRSAVAAKSDLQWLPTWHNAFAGAKQS